MSERADTCDTPDCGNTRRVHLQVEMTSSFGSQVRAFNLCFACTERFVADMPS